MQRFVVQGEQADLGMPQPLAPRTAHHHLAAGPDPAEVGAAGGQVGDQRGQLRVVAVAPHRHPQLADGLRRPALPLGVQRPGGGVEEQVPGVVAVAAAVVQAAEQLGAQPVPGHHVEAVVRRERREVARGGQESPQQRADAGLGRATSSGGGQGREVHAFRRVEVERAGQRVEDLGGRLGRPSLFQAHVVVHADARELGQFLAAQPAHPAATARDQPDVLRRHPPAPGTEEAAQHVPHPIDVHAVQYAWPSRYQDRRSAGRTGCWLPPRGWVKVHP